MTALGWIITGGLLMAAIAMVGSLTLLLQPATLERLLLPLVAFAAGSLIGGAFFHMIPAAMETRLDDLAVGVGVVAGFTAFLVLEQFLHWHHCQRAAADCRQPLTWLILIGDGLHNGATDLVPEVSRHGDAGKNLANLAAFGLGVLLMLLAKMTL